MGKIRGKKISASSSDILPSGRNCLVSTSQTKHPGFENNEEGTNRYHLLLLLKEHCHLKYFKIFRNYLKQCVWELITYQVQLC